MSDVYEPDFVERNGTWLLSMIGILVTCFSGLLAYFLKSRCMTIKCCGGECTRDVLDLGRVPETALQVELHRRQSENTFVASAGGSLVQQALRLQRVPRPKPPVRTVDVELTSTNSEAKS